MTDSQNPPDLNPVNPIAAEAPAPRLAPSTLGEILDRTVQLYRSRFLVFLGISLVPTALVVIPACGLFLVFAWVGTFSSGSATSTAGGVLAVLFLAGICLLIVPVLIGGAALSAAAMNYTVSRAYLGDKTTIRQAYKSAWPRGWRYAWLLILEGLIIGAAPLVVWIVLVALFAGGAALAQSAGLGALSSGALFGLSIFLVVAAVLAYVIWMALRLSLAFPACVVEQIPATAALRRSITLSKGTKGRIFLLYFLVGVLNWILSMGITVPLTMIMALLPGASSPKNTDTASVVLLLVIYGAGFVIQALTRPIYGTALNLFYYDQRIRQEGFDIEWMMQRAGMVVGPPSDSVAEPSSHSPESTETQTQIEGESV